MILTNISFLIKVLELTQSVVFADYKNPVLCVSVNDTKIITISLNLQAFAKYTIISNHGERRAGV